MKHSITFVLGLLSLRSMPPTVDAAAGLDPRLSCQDFIINGSSRQVCTTMQFYTPSPAQFENGTIVYMGPYGLNFDYWTGPRDGMDTSTFGARRRQKFSTGWTAGIEWLESDGSACTATINGAPCTSCRFCNTSADNLVSVDCSNVAKGGKLDCQPLHPVYFPFNSFPKRGKQS